MIIIFYLKASVSSSGSSDRIVVSTLHCGRNNPGSNPGHGTSSLLCFIIIIIIIIFWSLFSFPFFFHIFPNALMSSLVLICDVMFLSSVFGLFHLSSLYCF